MRLFPETSIIAVLLPESFRGGCSFGVGRPISPATISVCTNFRSCSVLSDRRFSSSRFARQKYRQNGAPMQQLNTRTVSPQSHGSSCSILVRRDETLLRLDHSNIGWAIERRRKWFARTPRAPDGAEPIL